MRRSIILNTDQVNRLQSEGALVIKIPVKGGPDQGWLSSSILSKVQRMAHSKNEWWTMAVGEYKEIVHCGHKMDGGHIGSVRCPYKAWQRIYVREKWMPSPNGDKNIHGQIIGNGFEYFATASEQYKEEWPTSWCYPDKMPLKAARLFPVVQNVSCTQDNGTWVFLIEMKIDIPLLNGAIANQADKK